MKTKIILFILLFAGYATAQDYKYFDDISISKGSLSFFAPKGMSPKEIKKEASAGLYASEVKYTEDFFNRIEPFFKESLGYPYPGDVNMLKKINCHFEYDKNFRIYYYSFSFPRSHIEEFPQWEEKLYRFFELCKRIDLTPFVYVWNKEKDPGASFMLNMFYIYRYFEDPSKVVFDRFE